MAYRNDLINRDPACEALFGTPEADFGSDEMDWADDYSDDFGEDDDDSDDDDEMEVIDAEMEGEFGAVKYSRKGGNSFKKKSRALSNVTPSFLMKRPAKKVVKAVAATRTVSSHRARRILRLNPNHGSSLKVEYFRMSMNTPLVLGTASAITMSANPTVTFKPEKAAMNAPVPGFALITGITAANINGLIGSGGLDAYEFSPNALNTNFELPMLSPAYRVSVTGMYTGITPTGYTAAAAYTFVATFTGPAKLMG